MKKVVLFILVFIFVIFIFPIFFVNNRNMILKTGLKDLETFDKQLEIEKYDYSK